MRQAEKNPFWLSRSDKIVTVSHHLAHAYSAFAACPFDEGAVMVVDTEERLRGVVTLEQVRRALTAAAPGRVV